MIAGVIEYAPLFLFMLAKKRSRTRVSNNTNQLYMQGLYLKYTRHRHGSCYHRWRQFCPSSTTTVHSED